MTPYYSESGITIYHGDCRKVLQHLPAESVQCCVTSPPYYGLRDYGVDGQIGLEPTPEQYVAEMVAVFREVRRVLAKDGTLWLNIGDSYAGSGKGGNPDDSPHKLQQSNKGSLSMRGTQSHGCQQTYGLKPKDLIGIPWMLAFALRADGWYLRQDIIWHKPNPMPESVTDRCTKAHEYIFLLSKSERYWYDADAIAEPAVCGDRGSSFVSGYDVATKPGLGVGPRRQSVARGSFNGKTNAMEGREAFRAIKDARNKRSVWTVTTKPYPGAHFATFPPDLIEPCIKAGSRPGDVVLDPFNGSGTTAQVSREHGRRYVGVELKEQYIGLTIDRLRQGVLFGSEVA